MQGVQHKEVQFHHFSPINEHRALSISTDEQGSSQIISEKACSLRTELKRMQGK